MKGEKLINNMNDDLSTINAMIHKLASDDVVDLGARLRSLTDRVKNVDDMIATLLKDSARPLTILGDGEGVLGSYYVALVTAMERSTFDTAAFKKFDPKVYSQFTRTQHIRSLRYKPL